MLDILIKNGTVIDGVGTPAFTADVGIKNGVIEAVGPFGSAGAKTVIDAAGLYVAPGFIDINNASDRHWALFNHPDMESFLYQGVTTIIGGNCGSSLAPLLRGNIISSIQKWADIGEINVNWLTLSEFLKELRKKKLNLNFGTLIGHGTLRRNIVSDEFRELTEKEAAQMEHLLAAALKEGALGFSTGLSYSHAKVAGADEIVKLAGVLSASGGKSGKIYSTHLRDEGAGFYESVMEALAVAQNAKVSVEISHLKTAGKNNWALFDRGLKAIDEAAQNGVNINFDVYPYTTTATVLYTLLPDWIAVGGRKKLVENLRRPELVLKAIAEMKSKHEFLDDIVIASGNINKTFIGKTIAQIAGNQEISPYEAVINLLIASEGKVIAFWPALSEENLIKALSNPLSIVASDGAAYRTEDAALGYLAHPRSFGCFTRLLGRYVREKSVLTWEEAVKKITALPALKLGLTDRGVIGNGYAADITVFNPETVNDLATFENPFRYSAGISHVIVNGALALSDGKIRNKGLGQLLRA